MKYMPVLSHEYEAITGVNIGNAISNVEREDKIEIWNVPGLFLLPPLINNCMVTN